MLVDARCDFQSAVLVDARCDFQSTMLVDVVCEEWTMFSILQQLTAASVICMSGKICKEHSTIPQSKYFFQKIVDLPSIAVNRSVRLQPLENGSFLDINCSCCAASLFKKRVHEFLACSSCALTSELIKIPRNNCCKSGLEMGELRQHCWLTLSSTYNRCFWKSKKIPGKVRSLKALVRLHAIRSLFRPTTESRLGPVFKRRFSGMH